MAEKTDEVLMDEVAHGDLTGLETLIGRYKHKMLHYLSRTVEDAVLAEDLFQEVFLRVYKSREKYRFPLKFSTWLYTIARNLCLNEMEKRGLRKSVSLSEFRGSSEEGDSLTVEETLASETEDPLAQLQSKDRREIVQKALMELPEEQRTLLFLNAYEGMSYEEISGIVGCSRGAVKVRFFRAYRELEKHMTRLGRKP